MFCPRCATPNKEDSRFCMKCGQPLVNGAIVTPLPRVKKTKRFWYIIFVVPLAFVVLGIATIIIGGANGWVKTSSLTNPGITSSIDSNLEANVIDSDDSNYEDQSSTSASSQSAEEIERELTRTLGGFELLTEAGFSEAQADEYIKAANACGIGELSQVVFFTHDNTGKFTGNLEVSDGDFSVHLTVKYQDDALQLIKDNNDELLYDKGAKNEKYLYWNGISISQLKSYAEEAVLSVLKSPSTAEFPGKFLSPYEDWNFGKEKNYITISSYVDSQNSFGAMLRSNFIIGLEYSFETETFDAVYFKFGDEVLQDDRRAD